jgi:predicted CoA-binding protein
MDQVDYAELFATVKTFAVVGYSDNPQRAGHFVPAYLAKAGYRIVAVNPKFSGEVDGFPCYPSLSAIPPDVEVDVIDIFRGPQYQPEVLADTLQMARRPKYFWMQPGAENEAVAQQAAQAGLVPIMNACALAEHKHLSSP